MNLRTTFYVLFATVATGALAFSACHDNNTDDCPSAFADKDGNGLSCTSTDLQCPHAVPIVGCDGVQSTVASSCTCTKDPGSSAGAKWVCADPGNQCPDAGPTDRKAGVSGLPDQGVVDVGGNHVANDCSLQLVA